MTTKMNGVHEMHNEAQQLRNSVINCDREKETQFERAKAYLMRTDYNGTSVYDQLTRMMEKLLDTENAESLQDPTQLENMLLLLQRECFNGDSSTTNNTAPNSSGHDGMMHSVDRLKENKKLYERPAPVVRTTIEQPDPFTTVTTTTVKPLTAPSFPSVREYNQYWREVGCGLADEEAFLLDRSITKLAMVKHLQDIRFVGKIFGTHHCYYVISTRRYVAENEKVYVEVNTMGKPMRKKGKVETQAEPGYVGCNRLSFWVTLHPASEWILLPDVTPAQIVAARLITKRFTGDLQSNRAISPSFPWNEQTYLRAQLSRIVSSTFIAPQGALAIPEEEEEEEEEEDEEEYEYEADKDQKHHQQEEQEEEAHKLRSHSDNYNEQNDRTHHMTNASPLNEDSHTIGDNDDEIVTNYEDSKDDSNGAPQLRRRKLKEAKYRAITETVPEFAENVEFTRLASIKEWVHAEKMINRKGRQTKIPRKRNANEDDDDDNDDQENESNEENNDDEQEEEYEEEEELDEMGEPKKKDDGSYNYNVLMKREDIATAVRAANEKLAREAAASGVSGGHSGSNVQDAYSDDNALHDDEKELLTSIADDYLLSVIHRPRAPPLRRSSSASEQESENDERSDAEDDNDNVDDDDGDDDDNDNEKAKKNLQEKERLAKLKAEKEALVARVVATHANRPLRPIRDDRIADDDRTKLKIHAWKVRVVNNLDKAHAIIALYSLRWPGAIAFAARGGKVYGCVYFGNGMKRNDGVFTPPPAPRIMREIKDIFEVADPTAATEKLIRRGEELPEADSDADGEEEQNM